MSQYSNYSNTVNLPQTQLDLASYFYQALQNQLPVVVWQLPQSAQQHLMIDFHPPVAQVKPDLDELDKGFLISPFLNANLTKTYFIRADLHLSQGADNQIVSDISPRLSNEHLTMLENWANMPISHYSTINAHFLPQASCPHQEEEIQFKNLVKRGVEAIQNKVFQKVVLSRVKAVDYPTNFDIWLTFKHLCALYPRAFRYIFHLPQIGTWMGASPETLIQVDEAGIFQTVALAGTQAYQTGKPLSEAVWTQKEIEEQALVSRYIINCFKKIRLREFEEEGPKTVVAGNLLHLKTTFTVDTQAVNFPQLGTVMLDLLHPTSAVCGMPKEAALDFIQRYEGYNRNFYSGFLGPVNVAQASHLFVNLRCLQLFRNQIWLYAGAGITEDSLPDKEWRETEIKCQTMLKVLE
ncbi:MAG: chorismate-binding protein [Microscillaceae bacterium]|jgi:isochorismate synthase|nr:chorismate-binding protein [Microscillaceae bacterium]